MEEKEEEKRRRGGEGAAVLTVQKLGSLVAFLSVSLVYLMIRTGTGIAMLGNNGRAWRGQARILK